MSVISILSKSLLVVKGDKIGVALRISVGTGLE